LYTKNFSLIFLLANSRVFNRINLRGVNTSAKLSTVEHIEIRPKLFETWLIYNPLGRCNDSISSR